jgi:cation:H+ antiporter
MASLFTLVKGADFFVIASGKIAKKLGVSDFIIGLTLTSIGTSIPELAATISAAINGHSGLIVGNIVGSNIANIGVVLGSAAMVRAFKTNKAMFERDGYIMIACTLLFLFFSLNNQISRWESAIFLGIYIFYILFLIKSKNYKYSRYRFHDFMKYVFDFQYLVSLKNTVLESTLKKNVRSRTAEEKQQLRKFTRRLVIQALIAIVSLVIIMASVSFMIPEAVWLAGHFHLPENLIGLSLIALGTSLPELTVSISAARKGRGGMVAGNVIGSNIANIAMIIGITGFINPIQVSELSVIYTIPIMLFFSLALLYFIKSDWKIQRYQGLIALTAYIIFLVMAFYMGFN